MMVAAHDILVSGYELYDEVLADQAVQFSHVARSMREHEVPNLVVLKYLAWQDARLLGWVGGVLLVKDVVDLASPGLRATVPAYPWLPR